MALDTVNKRLSAIHVGLPWRGILPLPDGAIDQGDRQIIALLSNAVQAGVFVPVRVYRATVQVPTRTAVVVKPPTRMAFAVKPPTRMAFVVAVKPPTSAAFVVKSRTYKFEVAI